MDRWAIRKTGPQFVRQTPHRIYTRKEQYRIPSPYNLSILVLIESDPKIPCGLAGSSLMAHSICASFSPALSIPRFTSHTAWFNTRPVLRPVRTAQKLSISPRRPILVVKSAFPLSTPVIKPNDHWSTWAVLFSIAAFGIWSFFLPFFSPLIFEIWQNGIST